MAGNEKSGRKTAGEEKGKARAAAKTRRTKETAAALEQAARDRGDREFKVIKVYANGHKSFVGKIADPTDENAGMAFGGGVFECRLIDRVSKKETGETFILRPHPGLYPINPKFSMDPHQMERNGITSIPNNNNAPVGGGTQEGRPMNQQQIYDKAKEDLRREMEKEMSAKATADKLDELTKLVADLKANPPAQQKSFHEEAGNWFEFFKKMQPTPTPNQNQAPGSNGAAGLGQLDQTLATIKALQEFSKGMKGVNLFGSAGDMSPTQELMASNLGKFLDVGLKKWEAGAAMGLNTGVPGQPGQPSQPATVTPSPVATEAAPQPTEAELLEMQTELIAYVEQAQADYINSKPGVSIQHSKTWIEQHIQTGNLGWKQLAVAIKINAAPELVKFLGTLAPQLVDNEKKQNWLAALVDLLKAPPPDA